MFLAPICSTTIYDRFGVKPNTVTFSYHSARRHPAPTGCGHAFGPMHLGGVSKKSSFDYNRAILRTIKVLFSRGYASKESTRKRARDSPDEAP